MQIVLSRGGSLGKINGPGLRQEPGEILLMLAFIYFEGSVRFLTPEPKLTYRQFDSGKIENVNNTSQAAMHIYVQLT